MKTHLFTGKPDIEEIEDPAGGVLEIDDETLSRISGAHGGDTCSALCSPCPPLNCL